MLLSYRKLSNGLSLERTKKCSTSHKLGIVLNARRVNKTENIPASWHLPSTRKVGHKHSLNYIIKCCDNFCEVN